MTVDVSSSAITAGPVSSAPGSRSGRQKIGTSRNSPAAGIEDRPMPIRLRLDADLVDSRFGKLAFRGALSVSTQLRISISIPGIGRLYSRRYAVSKSWVNVALSAATEFTHGKLHTDLVALSAIAHEGRSSLGESGIRCAAPDYSLCF